LAAPPIDMERFDTGDLQWRISSVSVMAYVAPERVSPSTSA
jgi:hypothetical protein